MGRCAVRTHLHLGDGVCYSSDRHEGQHKRHESNLRHRAVAVLAEVVRKVLFVQAVERQEAAEQEGLVCGATAALFNARLTRVLTVLGSSSPRERGRGAGAAHSASANSQHISEKRRGLQQGVAHLSAKE